MPGRKRETFRRRFGSQTERPINSANRAISEIINKNRNEAKSTVIEAFLCGRPVGPLCDHDAPFNKSATSFELYVNWRQ